LDFLGGSLKDAFLSNHGARQVKGGQKAKLTDIPQYSSKSPASGSLGTILDRGLLVLVVSLQYDSAHE
jgi:hypothetical protein